MSDTPRSARSSVDPRFTGTTRARQPLRLAAALGILAGCAIAGGSLASLAAAPSSATPSEPLLRTWTSEPLEQLAPAHLLEQRVRAAEQSAASARAGLRDAKLFGLIDDDAAAALERRLEHLGGQRQPSSSAPTPEQIARPAHLRAIAPTVRDL